MNSHEDTPKMKPLPDAGTAAGSPPAAALAAAPAAPRPRRAQLRVDDIPDQIVFESTVRYLDKRWGATRIAGWIKDTYGRSDISRERVHHLVSVGIERRYVRVCPPLHERLALRIKDRFNKASCAVQVVDSHHHDAHEHVATVAAETMLGRILDLGHTRETVHVGFGPGQTTRIIAQKLAELLRNEGVGAGLPDLVLHALSSGFAMNDPRNAPSTFFAMFYGLPVNVRSVELCAPTLVDASEYDQIKDRSDVRNAIAQARQIDLLVTSLAQADDEHGALHRSIEDDSATLALLEQSEWAGEIQHRPFSAAGPIVTSSGQRAVTVFELDELAEFASRSGTMSLLVVGPCGKCGESKGKALRALLGCEKLPVFTHLVTDTRTAEDCVS